MNKMIKRAMTQRSMNMLGSAQASRALRMQDDGKAQPRNYEGTTISDQSRFEDEPEPTEDDQISKFLTYSTFDFYFSTIEAHYLKHHPFYEFKNHEDLAVDGYRHWLHGRADYFQSETYPGISAWEMGSKFNHMIYLTFPLFAFGFFGK